MLSVGGFAVYRSVTRGAEDNAAKTNVDRVLGAAEDYWQQFALDRRGVRQINLKEFCGYANSQFAIEDDLTLRSAAVVAGGATTAAVGPTKQTAVDASGGLAISAAAATAAPNRAVCTAPTTAADHAEVATGTATHYDVLFAAAAATGTTAGYQAGVATTMTNWQTAGLGNTRGVFMLQPPNTGTAGTSWATATATVAGVPAGTAVGKTDSKANYEKNEVLVVGAVSSSGNTFCAVKIFDADDRGHIGNYRYSKAPVDGKPVIPEPCLAGIPFADIGTEGDGGWKAAS